MSVSSFKSGRSGSSRSEVRPASSPNSSRAIPCSVCRRPDHHPTPPHATPPGELQRRRAHRAAPCTRRVHRPVRQPTNERAVLRRRQRALTKVRRRRESLTRRTRGRTESLQHARARAGRRERPHRALLLVPRRVRARPGLRRVPPLPSRVPVRRVRPTDTPVPPFGMRRARARRRGERRRPMHRPPRRRTRVAVGHGH
jgi:hypothetical protein